MQAHWLIQGEKGPVVGPFRTGPDDGAEMPTGVAGGIYSFPDGFRATWRTRARFVKFFLIA